MPTYEYACGKCGHEFEREQRITDDPVKTCPACKAAQARRLISRTSFVLKGGGWYNDLYATPKAKDAKNKEDKAADASAGGEAGKAKEKPAAKPEKKASSSPKPDSGPKAAA